MPKGLARALGTPTWVRVDYGKHQAAVDAETYKKLRYEPPFDQLPWIKGKGALQNRGRAGRKRDVRS